MLVALMLVSLVFYLYNGDGKAGCPRPAHAAIRSFMSSSGRVHPSSRCRFRQTFGVTYGIRGGAARAQASVPGRGERRCDEDSSLLSPVSEPSTERVLRGRNHSHAVWETRAVTVCMVQPRSDHTGQLDGVTEVHRMGCLVHDRDRQVLRSASGNVADAVG